MAKYPLEIVEAMPDNPYLYKLPDRNHRYQVRVKLPSNLTCSQCVFQWTYTAGKKSWVGELVIRFFTFSLPLYNANDAVRIILLFIESDNLNIARGAAEPHLVIFPFVVGNKPRLHPVRYKAS